MPATGDVLSHFELPVGPEKAREMAVSLGADGWKERTATSLQGEEVVPTFTVTSGFWQDRREILTQQLGFELGRLLHGGQSWTYARLPRVGELLHGTTVLGDITEKAGKRGGRMRFVTLLNRYVDADERVVLEEASQLIDLERQPGADGSASPAPTPSPEHPIEWAARRTITRTDLVRYAGASGDFNPIHHDEGFAREQGLPTVFSMGLLQGGLLAVELGRHEDLGNLRAYRIRFTDRVWPDDEVLLGGWHDGRTADGHRKVRLVATVDGRTVLTGEAELLSQD